MNRIQKASGAVAFVLFTCINVSGGTCSGADPFYYSTWYAPPAPALTWAGTSVLHGYPRDVYSSFGPANFDSPVFFQPGYGAVAPVSPFRTTLRYYDQGYAFGSLRYGTPPGLFLNPAAEIGGYSAIGIKNRFGGITPIGVVHSPWYLPGSPANDREFLFRW